MNKNAYRSQVIKALNIEEGTDTVNVVDDQPELLFGPEVDGKPENGTVPPFYISLNIHDKTLHNAMLDSGASHNLMPKAVMEKLGLDITRPYKDLYSFDSSKVKCIGLIKDLCVTLAQIPAKSLVMDIVVVDIPPKYGMLLSRSWGAKLQGTLQLDMTYATIPLFGQHRRLYRETLMKYMVSSQDKPHNYPLYYVHSDLDSFILYNDGDIGKQIANLENDVYKIEEDKTVMVEPDKQNEPLWNLDFDGVVSKEGSGAGVWVLNSKTNHSEGHSYKLNFQCTNNIVEYEALILGLQLLKKLGAKRISIHGDSELIIKQIKGEYSAKHPRLRAYMNVVLDFLECFIEYDLSAIPRDQNILADGLATSASTCKIPFPS
jgi:ribonuclease HI